MLPGSEGDRSERLRFVASLRLPGRTRPWTSRCPSVRDAASSGGTGHGRSSRSVPAPSRPSGTARNRASARGADRTKAPSPAGPPAGSSRDGFRRAGLPRRPARTSPEKRAPENRPCRPDIVGPGMEEMVVADLIQRRRGGVGRDVPADRSVCSPLVGPDDHRHRIPADDRLDPPFDLGVARIGGAGRRPGSC
jgi:hypothetical protein